MKFLISYLVVVVTSTYNYDFSSICENQVNFHSTKMRLSWREKLTTHWSLPGVNMQCSSSTDSGSVLISLLFIIICSRLIIHIAIASRLWQMMPEAEATKARLLLLENIEVGLFINWHIRCSRKLQRLS